MFLHFSMGLFDHPSLLGHYFYTLPLKFLLDKEFVVLEWSGSACDFQWLPW